MREQTTVRVKKKKKTILRLLTYAASLQNIGNHLSPKFPLVQLLAAVLALVNISPPFRVILTSSSGKWLAVFPCLSLSQKIPGRVRFPSLASSLCAQGISVVFSLFRCYFLILYRKKHFLTRYLFFSDENCIYYKSINDTIQTCF